MESKASFGFERRGFNDPQMGIKSTSAVPQTICFPDAALAAEVPFCPEMELLQYPSVSKTCQPQRPLISMKINEMIVAHQFHPIR
jgi:hypothetical protein